MVFSGVFFGIAAMLGYGIASGIAKSFLAKINNVKAIFYRNIFASIFLLLILFAFIDKAVFSLKYVVIAFAISLIGYLPFLLFYKAISLGKVGVVVPIADSSSVFTVLFSVIFFGEKFSGFQIIAIAFVIIGIFFLTSNIKEFKLSVFYDFSSGIPYALLTCFLWGVVYFLFKFPVSVLGPILTSFIIEFGILIYSAIHILISKKGYKLDEKSMIVPIFFAALFASLGTLFYNIGIQNNSVGLIAVIGSAGPLVSAAYARIAYNEKLKIYQYLSILIIIAGIAIISYV